MAFELNIRSSFAAEEGLYWITLPWVEAMSPLQTMLKGHKIHLATIAITELKTS